MMKPTEAASKFEIEDFKKIVSLKVIGNLDKTAQILSSWLHEAQSQARRIDEKKSRKRPTTARK